MYNNGSHHAIGPFERHSCEEQPITVSALFVEAVVYTTSEAPLLIDWPIAGKSRFSMAVCVEAISRFTDHSPVLQMQRKRGDPKIRNEKLRWVELAYLTGVE